ncbi:MAG: hypothetical protein LBT86_02250 [Deltaproteobacteria bacterium]|jgi:hypothetical protein|nr:hypothetical protein [Deltaproteobacteria bacterium]
MDHYYMVSLAYSLDAVERMVEGLVMARELDPLEGERLGRLKTSWLVCVDQARFRVLAR